MEDGLLSLKWNNHKTTFFEILKLLRDKSNYADATLAVEGKFYPVHKLVLSTCSEYFSEIFEHTNCKSPVIVLKDVRSQDLESLLDYMYLGEVNVNQNDLALLLKTAECLRIKGLAVPDDEPVRHSSASSVLAKVHPLNKDDGVKDMPSSKRRRQDSSSASIALSPPRISPSSKIPASPSHTSSSSHPHKTPAESCSPHHDSEQHETALVKVEMEDTEGEDNFPNDNCDSNVDPEHKDYIEKAEHDPSSYSNANFSAQHTGDMQWEDGENSFPQDSFGGDSSQQAGGGASLYTWNSNAKWPTSSCEGDVAAVAAAAQLNQSCSPRGSGTEYRCAYCSKLFSRPSHLKRHERTHTGEKPFHCPYCPHASSLKENLKAHLASKHRSECSVAVFDESLIQECSETMYSS